MVNYIDPPHCQIANQAAAKRKFRRYLHRATAPVPYLFSYQDTNYKNVFWLEEEKNRNVCYQLPAFGTNGDDTLFFSEKERTQLKEGSFFCYQGEYYTMINDGKNGLALKQISVIDTPEMLATVANYWNLGSCQFILCKAYEISREHPFIAYVWNGYRYNEQTDTHLRAPLAVFPDDDNKLLHRDPWNLHYIVVNPGEIISHNGKQYVAKINEQGVYIDSLPFKILE